MTKRLVLPFALGTILPLGLVSLAAPPAYDHVVVVVEENKSYNDITNLYAASAPYINQTLIPQGANFTNFHGQEHPSEGNYFWMFSGSNQNMGFTNPCPVGPYNTPNLGASLIAGGHSFKGYSEDLPSIGSQVCISGAYARKHNPWVSFGNLPVGTTVETSSNLRMADFPTDFSQLPTVSFVVPNQTNDMHDGAPPGSVAIGDAWLQAHIGPYYEWAKTHNSLLIVTFDEDAGGGAGLSNPQPGVNQVTTIMGGAGIAPGAYGQGVNHVNMLRMLEDMYALPHAGAQTAPATLAGFSNTAIKGIFVEWKFDADGSWNDAANWVGNVAPSGESAVANLLSASSIERTITIYKPITLNVLNFDNEKRYTIVGTSTITLTGVSDATSAVHVTSGNHVIAAPLSLQRNTTLNVKANATLTLSDLAPTAVNVEKRGDGRVEVNRIIANELKITAGTVVVTSGTSKLASLALAGGAKPTVSLDLIDHDALITGVSRADVQALINYARNGGAWDRSGVTSSAARDQLNHATTLGVLDAQQFQCVYGDSATFDGFTLNASDVLIQYTYYGDTDFNGVVDFDDYSRIDNGFNNNLTGWFNGDFDANGVVDFDDYSLIDHAFNTQSSLKAIPEPASLTLLAGLGALGNVARCRRRPAAQRSRHF